MGDRLNTIFGWVLFSGVIALGLTAISSRVFHADKAETPENPGYVIVADEGEGGADAGPSLATLLTTGDAGKGEAVFAKCMACHTIAQGGADGIGPNLYGVLGKPIGQHEPGFAYSSALSGHGGDWTYENMDHWLTSPRGFADGTKMSFAGLSSAEDRANVILYLRANGGGPDLPEPEAEETEEPDAALAMENEGADAEASADEPSEAAPEEDEVVVAD
ncbi:c-type cytochrome [Aurantiacibacter suaedae]|uniref:c-type cytochrome n=1 Tax=Aurantiacibacter suaedae TaxID=2545755 RepID=UPI0010FA464E|nr:cytochrome c family protein [Aurantiacibacter suaedae]